MAKGISKVFLIGNVGSDPEALRYTQSGIPALNLSIATSDSWKDKQTGEQKERTSWHRVVLYNRLAEIAHQYLRKGSKVWIEGRLQYNEWQKEGQTHRTAEIIGNDLQMLDSRSSTGDSYQASAPQKQSSTPPNDSGHQSEFSEESFDDDIPF